MTRLLAQYPLGIFRQFSKTLVEDDLYAMQKQKRTDFAHFQIILELGSVDPPSSWNFYHPVKFSRGMTSMGMYG